MQIKLSSTVELKAQKTFEAQAYSGSPLRYRGERIIIDTATLTAADKFPTLLNHDATKPTGMASVSDKTNRIAISGALLDSEHGNHIEALNAQGFPWQLSVGVEFEEKQKVGKSPVMVNGMSFANGYILRNATLREVSFTPVGVDGNTFVTMEKETMEIEQLTAELSAVTVQLAKLKADNDSLQAENIKLKTQIIDAGKKERLDGIRAMFSAIGREYNPESDAVKVYMDMDKATFSAVANDILMVRGSTNELFVEKVTLSTEEQSVRESDFKRYGG